MELYEGIVWVCKDMWKLIQVLCPIQTYSLRYISNIQLPSSPAYLIQLKLSTTQTKLKNVLFFYHSLQEMIALAT